MSRPSDRTDPTRFDGGGESNETDVVVEALANPWRRTALRTCLEGDEGVYSLDELVDRVLERRPDLVKRNRRPDADFVRLGFLHVHLPKLTAAGLLEYDRYRDRVTYLGNPMAEAVLEALDRPTDVE